MRKAAKKGSRQPPGSPTPDAVMGEGLSIHYSGGSTLSADISDWLAANQIAAP